MVMKTEGTWDELLKEIIRAFPHAICFRDNGGMHFQSSIRTKEIWCRKQIGRDAVRQASPNGLLIFDESRDWTFGPEDSDDQEAEVFFFKNSTDAVMFRMKWS
jgi:hypothetical protein